MVSQINQFMILE